MKVDKVKTISDIYIGEYPFHKELYDEMVPVLEDYCDRQERSTNVKATMTEWTFDSKGEYTTFKGLKKSILDFFRINYALNTFMTNTFSPQYDNFWANIYRRGDYTIEHDHVCSFFSCVYFLKSPKRSAPLVFSYSGKKIPAKEGTFVLFPSHLRHHVPVHRSDDTRITLSGNIRVQEET